MITFLLIVIAFLLILIYRALLANCRNQVVHAQQFGFILTELRRKS